MLSSSKGKEKTGRRLIFTPASKEIYSSKNQLFKAMRDDHWYVVMELGSGSGLIRDVDGQVLINGKVFPESPEEYNNLSKEDKNAALIAFIRRELFQDNEATWDEDQKTIDDLLLFWNQSLMSTAMILMIDCVQRMMNKGMLPKDSVPALTYTTNLQRDAEGRIFVETVTTGIYIHNPHFREKLPVPGSFIVRFELRPKGYVFRTVEASNPFLQALLCDGQAEIKDIESMVAVIKGEIAEIEHCEDEQLKGWARNIIDFLEPYLHDLQLTDETVGYATVYGILSLTKMLTQNPNDQTLYLCMQRLVKNKPEFEILSIYINSLIQTYQPALMIDMSRSLYYKAPQIKKLDAFTEPKTSQSHWKKSAYLLAGSLLGIAALGTFIGFTLLTSGAALPALVAAGTYALALASAAGLSTTSIPPAIAGGLVIFTGLAPIVAAIGYECAYLLKKSAAGLANFFSSAHKEQPLASSKLRVKRISFEDRSSEQFYPRYLQTTPQRSTPSQTSSPSIFCCFYSKATTPENKIRHNPTVAKSAKR